MLGDELLHLLVIHRSDIQIELVLEDVVLDELIRAETLVALLAVHQRIVEPAHMPGRDPGFRVHENGAVQTDVIAALGDEFAPPCPFDIVFELDAQRAVIPCIGEAAVDFRAGENKASIFRQRDDFIHCFFASLHTKPPKIRIDVRIK